MPKKKETLEDIARRYEALIDDESQDHAFVPVTAHVELKGSVFAAHFLTDEVALLHKAAQKKRASVIEFIRDAALTAASNNDRD